MGSEISLSMDAKPSAARFVVVQLSLAVLTIATLAVLLAEETLTLSPEIVRIVQAFDAIVCGIFFVDFCVRLVTAPSKSVFLRWGWIDLVACVPNVDILRIGRLVRVLRIVRLVRSLRATHRLLKVLLHHRANSTIVLVMLTMLLVATFASGAILMAEGDDPEANIRTAGDAVWWSLTTITTVGYGDRFPVTIEGRALAIVLMFCGVGFFGTLSGLIATWLLGKDADDSPDIRALSEQVAELRREILAMAAAPARPIFREVRVEIPAVEAEPARA